MSFPRNLFGLDGDDLAALAGELGLPAYRGKQLYRALYARGVESFEEMTDLPKSIRRALSERFTIAAPSVVERVPSRDGTTKYRFRLEDGRHVEAVYIPDPPRGATAAAPVKRHTVCISTQVGCPLRCSFCFSGTVPFTRNLTVGEVLGQVRGVERELAPAPPRLNLVFMGMGEPLLNAETVLKALRILTDPEAYAISPRRITVSTAGLASELERFAAKAPPVGLAVSLHATNNEARSRMMPINRKYPLEELIETARRLPLPRRRKITFEYVLLAGENDSEEDARRLAHLLRGLKAKVNLIQYNPWPGSPHRRTAPRAADRFLAILADSGYTASLRKSRGDDVLAACGQLANGGALGEPGAS